MDCTGELVGFARLLCGGMGHSEPMFTLRADGAASCLIDYSYELRARRGKYTGA